MASFIPGCAQLVRDYKQATEAVFSWLKHHAKVPVMGTVNENLHFAAMAAQENTLMPEDIRQSLNTAIHLRSKVLNLHKENGTADYGHEYIIAVLQTIWGMFSPPPTSFQQPEAVRSTPYQWEESTLCQQEAFYPLPPCDYDHIYQPRQPPQTQQLFKGVEVFDLSLPFEATQFPPYEAYQQQQQQPYEDFALYPSGYPHHNVPPGFNLYEAPPNLNGAQFDMSPSYFEPASVY